MKKLFYIPTIVTLLTGTAYADEPIWDANLVNLESHEIAEGVFIVQQEGANELAAQGIPLATSSGFVIGEKGVVVIDTMLNERLNSQLFDLIEKETDKDVIYAINTSFHGDHAYGNQYLPDDTQIIQHKNTSEYIASHFDADKDFMITNFGEGRGIEEIDVTSADVLVPEYGELEINLGNRIIKIKDYGFAQTGGDLFVSLPEENVLWTGNAIVAPAPALPWLLDGHLVQTRDTLADLYVDFDADTKIIPGHGPVTDIASIKWNIDYLTAIEGGVKSAIEEGLTLEETIENVKLPEFEGYALFGWVHPGLNIPAAYADLK